MIRCDSPSLISSLIRPMPSINKSPFPEASHLGQSLSATDQQTKHSDCSVRNSGHQRLRYRVVTGSIADSQIRSNINMSELNCERCLKLERFRHTNQPLHTTAAQMQTSTNSSKYIQCSRGPNLPTQVSPIFCPLPNQWGNSLSNR